MCDRDDHTYTRKTKFSLASKRVSSNCCIIPKDHYVIFRAIGQGLRPPAAYDAEVGVRGDGLLHQRAEVCQGASDIVHHDVVSGLQQSLK